MDHTMIAPDAEVPDHDPAMIAALVRALGADRLAVLTNQLGAQIAALAGSEAAVLAQSLHRLRGAAASLGLPRLAAAIAAIDPETADADRLAAGLSALVVLHLRGKAAAMVAAADAAACAANMALATGHDGATKR